MRGQLGGSGGDLTATAFAPGDEAVLPCGTDGAVMWWDFATGKASQGLSTGGIVRGLAVAAKADIFAAVGEKNTAAVGKAGTGTFVGRPEGAMDPKAVAVSQSGRFVAVAGEGSGLSLWNAKTLAPLASWTAFEDGGFVATSADGTCELAPGSERRVVLVQGDRWFAISPEYERAHRGLKLPDRTTVDTWAASTPPRLHCWPRTGPRWPAQSDARIVRRSLVTICPTTQIAELVGAPGATRC